MVESWKIFLGDNFKILCLWLYWYCAKKVAYFFHSFSKQKHTLDRILTTVRSTAFVHICGYNQHKMKVPEFLCLGVGIQATFSFRNKIAEFC